jgi:hypothetical protein
MSPPIPRPGSANAAAEPDDMSVEVPLKVIADSLITGTFAGLEIWGAGTATLGAFEAVVLFGTVMSGAGAVVLLIMGVGALFSMNLRSQLAQTNKMIGVMTSPGGLPVMVAAEAAGYSEKEALRVGEYAKNVFSAYKVSKDVAKGLEELKEQLSALNDMREIREFIHERFEEHALEPEAKEPEASDPMPRSPEGMDGFHIGYDAEGRTIIFGTFAKDVRPAAPQHDDNDGNADPGDIGDRPGQGEIDRGNDGDRDPGDRDGDGGGRGDE